MTKAFLNSQIKAIDKLNNVKCGALFMEAGTGKTRSALELIRNTDDVGACKYMVKRILLCDWEGNITWKRDFEFNYSKDQILYKNKLKREDEIIKKWMKTL